jgi:hypothetical protein
MTEADRERIIKLYGEMFTTMIDIRKSLKNPVTKEERHNAEEAAIKMFESEEFGNLVSMSTLYKSLE